MPVVTNHKGPSFREYSRTPAERKLIELESKVADLEKKLAQLTEPASNDSSKDTKETTD